MEQISPVAAHVIAKCGGVKPVAKALKIDVSRVYRFTHATEKGGTGGLIPARHQQILLEKFKDSIEPADFFA
jgi:hypothetical protein